MLIFVHITVTQYRICFDSQGGEGEGLQRFFLPYHVTMLIYVFCIKKLNQNYSN